MTCAIALLEIIDGSKAYDLKMQLHLAFELYQALDAMMDLRKREDED